MVLSGTASDGTLGLTAIRAAAGITFCQDESAKFDSMPRTAIARGVADFILPTQQMAVELAGIARHPSYSKPEHFAKRQDGPALQRLFNLLRSRTAVDLKEYKQPTIQRRLTRRMALRKTEDPKATLPWCRRNPRNWKRCSTIF